MRYNKDNKYSTVDMNTTTTKFIPLILIWVSLP